MNSNLIKLALDLKKFNDDYKRNKHRMISLNNVYNSKFLYFNHFLANEKFIDSPYRNLLINTFKKSENISPGSCYDISVNLCNKILGNHIEKNKNKTERNLDFIFNYLKSMTDTLSFNTFKEILEFSGPDATITCQATKNSEILAEKNCMPTFDIKLENTFIPIYFNNVKKTTKNVILSVIDGYIERESELVPLIEESRSKKLPIVMICRGISTDATRNLKNILLRNKIVLYPFVSKFDDNDPFLFEDIAKTGKTKVISSETMDVIYTDTVKYCSECKLTISADTIKFFESSEDVIDSINNQIKSAKENNNFKVMNYLFKRKRRIMPNNVVVNFPYDCLRIMNEIKSLIRCYNIAAIGGVYYNENIIRSVYTDTNIERLSDSLYKNISNIGYTLKIRKNENE